MLEETTDGKVTSIHFMDNNGKWTTASNIDESKLSAQWLAAIEDFRLNAPKAITNLKFFEHTDKSKTQEVDILSFKDWQQLVIICPDFLALFKYYVQFAEAEIKKHHSTIKYTEEAWY